MINYSRIEYDRIEIHYHVHAGILGRILEY